MALPGVKTSAGVKYCADDADFAAIMRIVAVVLYLIRTQVCACSFYRFGVDGSSKAYKNI